MTSYRDDPVFTALWHAHRRRMLDLAFRMLLDLRDAEDVVQEAFTRLARTDIASIDDPEGWLVVVTSRLCLDRLRTRRRRPTDALDAVDDPFDPQAVDPSSQVTLVDNVTLAMHALLERLSPAERTSFVLHDVFQYPFDEIATIVGRSPAACRQLASRARRTLRAESAAGRFPVDSALQRKSASGSSRPARAAISRACWRCSTRPSTVPATSFPGSLVGAAEVAPGILRYLGPPASPTLLHLPVGDRVGIVALRDHRVLALVLLTIENGLVVHVDALAGPARVPQ